MGWKKVVSYTVGITVGTIVWLLLKRVFDANIIVTSAVAGAVTPFVVGFMLRKLSVNA